MRSNSAVIRYLNKLVDKTATDLFLYHVIYSFLSGMTHSSRK